MAQQEIDNGPNSNRQTGAQGGDITERPGRGRRHVDDTPDLGDDDVYDEPEELEPDEGSPDDIPRREQLQATYNEGSAEVVQGAWQDTLSDDERLTASAVGGFDKEGSAPDYNEGEERLRQDVEDENL